MIVDYLNDRNTIQDRLFLRGYGQLGPEVVVVSYNVYRVVAAVDGQQKTENPPVTTESTAKTS